LTLLLNNFLNLFYKKGGEHRQVMNQCLICGLEYEQDDEVCATCISFLKSKHGNKWEEVLERFRTSEDYIDEWIENSDSHNEIHDEEHLEQNLSENDLDRLYSDKEVEE